MLTTLHLIVEKALERLSQQLIAYLPSLLAGLVILLGAYLMAVLIRWFFGKIFKGLAVDRFLQQSGLTSILHLPPGVRAARIVSEGSFWTILGIGLLAALNAFDTQWTNNLVVSVVGFLPHLLVASLILLAGYWSSQFLGRGTLVWAVNEGLPAPRRIALALRLAVLFVAIVIAADHLNFARNVFLAAFILIMGGTVLALSLALGLGARGAVNRYLTRRYFHNDARTDGSGGEKSMLNHL
jgi:hypothetical protein